MKNKLQSILFLSFFALKLFAQQTPDKNISFRSQINYTNQFGSGSDLANIGGYVDSLGNEYALVGWEKGLSIVNVTNPASPSIVKQVNGNTSIWREVKTWKHYAYVTTEGGGGLQIINLRPLPNTTLPVKTVQTSIMGQTLSTIHALHIDTTKGNLYLYGSNISNKGALVYSLADPWNPAYLGTYDDVYVHDGYVDNDTLYACHIYNGYFTVTDMTNKTSPQVLAQQNTPNNFTHNSWLTPDRKTLLTTDEVNDSWLAAYDITDLNNITELDRIQSQNAGSQSIVHNTHVLPTGYAVTSWYKDGVVITDVHRPQNLINVGWYDTSPLQGPDFDGAWGVYPFLPSGNLVVSDISEGLFVLTPTYIRACYLEGMIMDSLCNQPMSGVTITASNGTTTFTDISLTDGAYRTGSVESGYYTVTFTKSGYTTVTVNNVFIDHGVVTNLNITMYSGNGFAFNGHIEDSSTVAISNANIVIENTNNNYSFTSNTSGDYNRCNLIADSYNVYAGKWGYKQYCGSAVNINSGSVFNIELGKGYYDDFTLNQGWTVQTTASSGGWERAVPQGTTYQSTPANPGNDVTGDCSNMAFITGNNGTTSSDDDVDNGYSILSSPVFDLSAITDPYLSYYRWFFNAGGSGTPNDSMKISLSNGITTVTLETILRNTANNSSWVHKQYKISDYLTPTANMQLKIRIVDASPGHLVEGGFDKFEIIPGTVVTGLSESGDNKLTAYPNPFDKNITIQFAPAVNSQLEIYDISGRLIEKQKLNNGATSATFGDELSNGIYLVKYIENGTTAKSIRIIKSN